MSSKTLLEEKYCHCLRKVRTRSKDLVPYGICTKSVYGSRGLKRKGNPHCNDFENWTVKELKSRLREKRVKGYSTMKKKDLIDVLRSFDVKKNNKR